MKINFTRSVVAFLFVFSCHSLLAQNTITGVINDEANEAPMSFASVGIPILGIGTTSELDGTYQINNIPDGTYQLVVSYTGYVEQSVAFTVANNQTLEINVVLSSGVVLETVEVSAQAIGQRAAINQQINSNTIVNVISKEKLQELPDQNAAEAIGRLPGVAIQRDGGEGQKVVVRGLSPRFSSVTINGERMPSTDGEDRSVDLSMISPDMLAGVELFKALTPDMDADAIGGTVNFAIRKADDNWAGDARLLHGYNSHEDRFGLWRTSFSLSNRFGKANKFGALVTGNFQRADRSSDLLNAEYAFGGINAEGDFITQLVDLNLGDRQEIRDRYGAGATLDYQLKNGSILANTMWGRTERDELRRRRRYRPSNSYQEYDLRDRQLNTNLISNSLTGEHRFGTFDVRWRASHSVSTQKRLFPYPCDSEKRQP
ncbi:MAG: TonB-dependent receptor plug domain-containing protein [Saprospiraceae bacterium]|nr:TonB-dependent receptor plug domain-containing protein [Saprospiraceae bacterium]